MAEAIEHIHQTNIAKRRQLFFEELKIGKRQLTDELIQNEDFLFCYDATVRAIQRTLRTEKIKFYATLILNTTHPDASGTLENYNDMLSLLDTLSCDDLRLIFHLTEKIKMGTPLYRQDDGITTHIYGSIPDNIKEINLRDGDPGAIIANLTSKGLLQLDIFKPNATSPPRIDWVITPRMYNFSKLIKEYQFPNM